MSPPPEEVCIHSDSRLVQRAMEGTARWRRPPKPFLVAQAAHRVLEHRVRFALRHVHAHEGHPWNETADSIATAARLQQYTVPLPSGPGDVLLDSELARNWAWYFSLSPAQRDRLGLPVDHQHRRDAGVDVDDF